MIATAALFGRRLFLRRDPGVCRPRRRKCRSSGPYPVSDDLGPSTSASGPQGPKHDLPMALNTGSMRLPGFRRLSRCTQVLSSAAGGTFSARGLTVMLTSPLPRGVRVSEDCCVTRIAPCTGVRCCFALPSYYSPLRRHRLRTILRFSLGPKTPGTGAIAAVRSCCWEGVTTIISFNGSSRIFSPNWIGWRRRAATSSGIR